MSTYWIGSNVPASFLFTGNSVDVSLYETIVYFYALRNLLLWNFIVRTCNIIFRRRDFTTFLFSGRSFSGIRKWSEKFFHSVFRWSNSICKHLRWCCQINSHSVNDFQHYHVVSRQSSLLNVVCRFEHSIPLHRSSFIWMWCSS